MAASAEGYFGPKLFGILKELEENNDRDLLVKPGPGPVGAGGDPRWAVAADGP